jgi:anti-sigma regulatory factor (Ser/Thr protein kinase)
MVRHDIGFQLRNDLSELETLQKCLERFQTEAGIPEKSLFEINLVLDELFTNIVSCGFRDMDPHQVEITITREGRWVTICVRDDGVPFNPTAAASPEKDCTIEERRIGGIGLHLVRRLTDEMTYLRQGACNIITLRKQLP